MSHHFSAIQRFAAMLILLVATTRMASAQVDAMLAAAKQLQGWIDDLANNHAYGPMSEQEFSNEKIKLRMPDIQLMSVDEAKAKGTWLYGDGRQSA